MTERDFYQILGVAKDASSSDIRAAFVRLSKRHHPDATGHDLALPWRLQDVQQAYHCLSDTTARAAHDRALAAEARQHFVRQQGMQHRLKQYDRRHPRAAPRRGRRSRWWIVLVAAVLTAIAMPLCTWLFD